MFLITFANHSFLNTTVFTPNSAMNKKDAVSSIIVNKYAIFSGKRSAENADYLKLTGKLQEPTYPLCIIVVSKKASQLKTVKNS